MFKNFFKEIKSDNIGAYAAQCAYFSLLSSVPFIILLLSLIKYVDIDQEKLEYMQRRLHVKFTMENLHELKVIPSLYEFLIWCNI